MEEQPSRQPSVRSYPVERPGARDLLSGTTQNIDIDIPAGVPTDRHKDFEDFQAIGNPSLGGLDTVKHDQDESSGSWNERERVEVEWQDAAYNRRQMEWKEAGEERLMTMKLLGYLVEDNEEFIIVTDEIIRGYEGGHQDCRGIHVIPRGNVKAIRRLKEG